MCINRLVGNSPRQFLLHTVSNTGVHGGSTGEHNVSVEVTTDIKIALVDGVVGGLVDASGFKTEERGLEESFGGAEAANEVSYPGPVELGRDLPLIANGDDLSIGQLVALLQSGTLGSGGHLLLEVKSDVAQFLLDISDDFTFGRGGEWITTFHKNLDEVIREISSSQVETENGVWESETFVNGDSVRDTITGIQDDTSRSSGCVQGEHGLDGDVESGGVEGLEHDLGHLLAICLRVQGSLCE